MTTQIHNTERFNTLCYLIRDGSASSDEQKEFWHRYKPFDVFQLNNQLENTSSVSKDTYEDSDAKLLKKAEKQRLREEAKAAKKLQAQEEKAAKKQLRIDEKAKLALLPLEESADGLKAAISLEVKANEKRDKTIESLKSKLEQKLQIAKLKSELADKLALEKAKNRAERQALQKKQKEDAEALKLEKKKLREEKKAQQEASAAIAKENKLKKNLDAIQVNTPSSTRSDSLLLELDF